MKANLKHRLFYSLVSSFLCLSSSVIALPTHSVIEVTTENKRNILPKQEAQDTVFLSTAEKEELFKAQLGILTQNRAIISNLSGKENNDPSVIFFNSLLTCTAGQYHERNILDQHLGTTLLSHKIIGIQGDTCAVRMMTPNGKFANCKFNIVALQDIDDEYMLEGLKNYKEPNTTPKSVIAELSWSVIKVKNCIYSEYLTEHDLQNNNGTSQNKK